MHVMSSLIPFPSRRIDPRALQGGFGTRARKDGMRGRAGHGMGCGVDRLAPPQRNGNFAPQKPQEIDTEHLQTSAVAVIIIVTV